MARARNKTSQWAWPVTAVKAAGTSKICAPWRRKSAYKCGKRTS
ncbi:Uncharacterised protein [Vibrio cholerae]|nr:Uncharacterised protein [Vibrio cholerae]